MRKLYIYTGITPNQDNGRHFMFTDVSLYMAELQPHLLTEIDLKNYIINKNVAMLALSSLLTEENFDTVTYLVDYDNESGYFRCYTVLRATLDSKVTYTLEVDLWATFIKDCAFSKVHITRCNRQLSKYGIYDEPQSTEQEFTTSYCAPYYPTNWLKNDISIVEETQIYIVLLVQYNSSQSRIGNDVITTTKLMAINVNVFKEWAAINNKGILPMAVEICGAIYEVNGCDAQVIEAYVLPAPLIRVSETKKLHVTYKFQSYDGTTPSATVDFYEVERTRGLISYYQKLPTNPNYVYYFGTINGGIKLKKYTKNNNELSAYICSFIGATTIKIVVMQGENQKDITNDLAITLTTNASVTTSIREFTKAFTGTLDMFGSIGKDISKGNYIGAGLSGISSFVGQFGNNKTLNKAIGSGDAMFIYGDGLTLSNPFVITSYESVNDANKHVNMFGATFDYFGTDGNALTTFDFSNKSMLGSGSVEDTYIVASVDVDGVPMEAHNEIGRKLTAGIYYKLLTT